MNAFDFIGRLRLRGIKPRFVMLDLADNPIRPWCTDSGAVHAEIGGAESLTSLDFRPLVGLQVHLGDRSANAARLRKVAKLAAEAKPAMLAVFTDDSMHRLWADGTSDRSPM